MDKLRRWATEQRGSILLFTTILVVPLMIIIGGLAMDLAYYGEVDDQLRVRVGQPIPLRVRVTGEVGGRHPVVVMGLEHHVSLRRSPRSSTVRSGVALSTHRRSIACR